MKNILVFLSVFLILFSVNMGFSKDKLLVFTKSARYKYQSIENAIKTIETLGYQNNFEVIQTEQDFKQHLFGVILHRMYH